MGTLFEKARIIDDPRRNWLSRAQCADRVPRRLSSNCAVIPGTLANEVKQAVVQSTGRLLLASCARRHRLNALALTVTQDPEGIHRERVALRFTRQMSAD